MKALKLEASVKGAWVGIGVLAVGLLWSSAGPLAGQLFPGAQYAVGDRPESVAIGDVNGDQAPNLAVANADSDSGCVLLNKGDGAVAFGDIDPFVLALTDPPGCAAPLPERDIMNADMNEDTKVDFGDIDPLV